MNLAYFRKSSSPYKETLENVRKRAEELGFEMLGEIELPENQGKVFQLCVKGWFSGLISSQKDLFSLLPCNVLILNEDNQVLVGVGNASILGKLSDNPSVLDISTKAESTFRKLVDDVCGVGPLKVEKIRLYATTSCPYCKMEASFLDQNKIEYDYVLVDLDQRAAEEMVKKTGQMGVPVTEIIYDNGDEEYVVGFDKAKLSEIFSLKN